MASHLGARPSGPSRPLAGRPPDRASGLARTGAAGITTPDHQGTGEVRPRLPCAFGAGDWTLAAELLGEGPSVTVTDWPTAAALAAAVGPGRKAARCQGDHDTSPQAKTANVATRLQPAGHRRQLTSIRYLLTRPSGPTFAVWRRRRRADLSRYRFGAVLTVRPTIPAPPCLRSAPTPGSTASCRPGRGTRGVQHLPAAIESVAVPAPVVSGKARLGPARPRGRRPPGRARRGGGGVPSPTRSRAIARRVRRPGSPPPPLPPIGSQRII